MVPETVEEQFLKYPVLGSNPFRSFFPYIFCSFKRFRRKKKQEGSKGKGFLIENRIS